MTDDAEQTVWKCDNCGETFNIEDGERAVCPSCDSYLGTIMGLKTDCQPIPVPNDVGRIEHFQPGDGVPDWLFPVQHNIIANFDHPVAVLFHDDHYHLVPRSAMDGSDHLIRADPIHINEQMTMEGGRNGVLITGDSGQYWREARGVDR